MSASIEDKDLDGITRQVKHIVATLEGREDDGEPIDAWTYLEDVLDIEYIVNSKREYLGARVLVCFGGPNVWINTRTNQVEGYWWSDSCIMDYKDEIGLDEVLSEMWGCQ